ncbi:MAG: hypothetical protein ABI870_04360 [Rhodanobacter sp.]
MKRTTTTTATAPPSMFERVLKRVAGIGAIVSLLLALYQGAKLVHDATDRMTQVHQLEQVAQLESDRGESARAWTSIGQAIALADAAGPVESTLWSIDRRRGELRLQQQDIGMQWLRDARPGPGQPFSTLVDPVAPVLERGAAAASGQHLADLLGHLGWSTFLASRDTGAVVDPSRDYALALKSDPHNAYANAFWGHWMLWQHGDPAQAAQHFADALADSRAASGPVRAYVRSLQIAALHNEHSAAAGSALLQVVTDMRAHGEAIDASTRGSLKDAYAAFGRDADTTTALLHAVPPAEQVITLRQLAYDDPFMRSVLAQLQEAAGQPDQAMQTWRALKADAPDSVWVARANAAVARLSAGHAVAR